MTETRYVLGWGDREPSTIRHTLFMGGLVIHSGGCTQMCNCWSGSRDRHPLSLSCKETHAAKRLRAGGRPAADDKVQYSVIASQYCYRVPASPREIFPFLLDDPDGRLVGRSSCCAYDATNPQRFVEAPHPCCQTGSETTTVYTLGCVCIEIFSYTSHSIKIFGKAQESCFRVSPAWVRTRRTTC